MLRYLSAYTQRVAISNHRLVTPYVLDKRPMEALELSMSILRSVSPVHLGYMRNMGTMSVSIVCEGKLWGSSVVITLNRVRGLTWFVAPATC